jgi:tetratricopeptide (TPR) repeat protein
MEGKKYFIIFLFLFGSIVALLQNVEAQSKNSAIYEAYARGKMDKWYEVMKAFEARVDKNNLEQTLELINYYYGYSGWLVSVEEYDSAEAYIAKSDLILDKILVKDAFNATALAYKGAFIAYLIGISPYKALYLGSKSMNLIEQSLAIDSENIQGHIEMGNAMYYCPTAFGGDKAEAIIHYKNAAHFMEKEQLVENNWMYLNVMTALGQAYEATDQIQQAKLCYEKVLRVKPNFMWVGEELYPDMLKRHNL